MNTSGQEKKPSPPRGSSPSTSGRKDSSAHSAKDKSRSRPPSRKASTTSMTASTLPPSGRSKKKEREPVLYVDEGQGGTFNFANSSRAGLKMKSVDYIGMDGFFYGMGVYFQIDAHRCFAAHLDMNVERAEKGKISSREANEIKDKLLKRLNAEADHFHWKASSVHKKTVLFVCPWAEGDEVISSVKEALETFLSCEVPLDRTAWGFVIEPGQKDRVKYLKFDKKMFVGPRIEKALSYEQYPADLAPGGWKYTVGEKWGLPENFETIVDPDTRKPLPY